MKPLQPLRLSLPPPWAQHPRSAGGQNAATQASSLNPLTWTRHSHSLAQILRKTVQMPWGSSHVTVQTPDFYLRPGLWWCKFDFPSSSKFFLEACLHHRSPSCLFYTGCTDGLSAGLCGSGVVLFSWREFSINLGFKNSNNNKGGIN